VTAQRRCHQESACVRSAALDCIPLAESIARAVATRRPAAFGNGPGCSSAGRAAQRHFDAAGKIIRSRSEREGPSTGRPRRASTSPRPFPRRSGRATPSCSALRRSPVARCKVGQVPLRQEAGPVDAALLQRNQQGLMAQASNCWPSGSVRPIKNAGDSLGTCVGRWFRSEVPIL